MKSARNFGRRGTTTARHATRHAPLCGTGVPEPAHQGGWTRKTLVAVLAGLNIVLLACDDTAVSQRALPTAPAPNLSVGNLPPRSSDSPLFQWNNASDSLLWNEIVQLDSSIVVGVKSPGTSRGFWNGKILVPPGIVVAAERTLAQDPEAHGVNRDTLLPLVTARIRSLDGLRRIRRLGFVDFVEPRLQRLVPFDFIPCSQDLYTRADFYQVPTPGFNLGYDIAPLQYKSMLIDGAWPYSTGQGVNIGLTDTGVDLSYGAAAEWSSLHFREGQSANRSLFQQVNVSGNPTVTCGHGSKSAGLIAAPRNGRSMVGVAYGAGLISAYQNASVVVTDGTAPSLAIRAVAQRGARVISLPWGMFHPVYGYIYSSTVAMEIQYWAAPGPGRDIVFVGAAGTSPPPFIQNGVLFPARMPEVLAVSAANPSDPALRPAYANYGPELDVIAYTEELTTGTGSLSGSQSFTTLGGSSGATAVVTGLAALVRARFPSISNDSVRKRIVGTGRFACDKLSGWHIMVNAQAAVGGLCVPNGSPVGPSSLMFDRLAFDPRTSTTAQYCINFSGGTGPVSITWNAALPGAPGSAPNCRVYTFSRGNYTRTITATLRDLGKPASVVRGYSIAVTVNDLQNNPSCPGCA